MIFHRSDGMLDSDILVFVVACPFAYSEQKVQIHHVIDDYREVPAAKVHERMAPIESLKRPLRLSAVSFHDSFDGIV